MQKKLQKPYVTYYNLLIAQDLLQVTFLKEFIELNVSSDTMIKKCKTCRINYKYWNYFLEYINFKDSLIEYKCLCHSKNYQV